MKEKTVTENNVIETVEIGGVVFNKDQVTPSEYFEYVKGLKQKLNYDDYSIMIDTTLSLLKKTKITGQTAMARELTHQLELAIRELDAAKDGFDIFVNRKDIERYIESVEGKSIKIVELENYERDIPDDIIDKLEKAREHFDKIYIFFTDYTLKETKKVAKERRDKDPIMFGAFHDKDAENKSAVYVEDRLFFIADWVDDQCDLTLEEIVRDIRKKDHKEITYKVSIPTDEEEVKKILNSYKKPLEETDLKPVSLFDKVKKAVKGKKSTLTLNKPATKRGRKKKEVDSE